METQTTCRIVIGGACCLSQLYGVQEVHTTEKSSDCHGIEAANYGVPFSNYSPVVV